MSEAILQESPLPGKVLRELRARAHALKPVVRISANGATEAVLREIDRSLRSHELIKLHAAVDGRIEREALIDAICAATGANAVQIIGKMLVVFRPNPPEPQSKSPARKASPIKRSTRAKPARSPAAARRRPPTKGSRQR